MAGPAPPTCMREAFNFENVQRNAELAVKGVKPTTTSTGTTIVSVMYKDGIVFGADTRASAGQIVADKKCLKVHDMTPNIYACGAGTAADCDHVTDAIASSLNLFRMEHGKEIRVIQAQTMLSRHLSRYQGYVGAHLIVGGVDVTGRHLCSISAHGFVKHHTYQTMGSGSLSAQAVLDSRYQDDMEEEAAKSLVADAIRAGIYNDLGSGGNVNLLVIKRVDGKTKVDKFIPYDSCNDERPYKKVFPDNYPKGTIRVLEETVQKVF